MSTPSLRSRLMYMAILPSLLAALVVGGYALVNHVLELRDTNAQRQQLITDSFAARLESLPDNHRAGQERLLRGILEEPNVRAAVLTFADDRPPIHAGPRLRPATRQQTTVTGLRTLTDSSWQLSRQIQPGVAATYDQIISTYFFV